MHMTHMREEDVVFEIPGVPLQRQHLLTWCPGIGKVEELPLVLVTLVCLQVSLPPIQCTASHSLLKGKRHVPFSLDHISVCFELCDVMFERLASKTRHFYAFFKL